MWRSTFERIVLETRITLVTMGAAVYSQKEFGYRCLAIGITKGFQGKRYREMCIQAEMENLRAAVALCASKDD